MQFRNEYRFLSNFWPCRIVYLNKTYPSVEHAYQVHKTSDEEFREMIRTASTPGKAKRMTKGIIPTKEFHAHKKDLMYSLLQLKFSDEELQKKLLAIEGEIIEDNYWHDNFWGNCICQKCKTIKGENMLGKLLMKLREEIQTSKI